MIKVNYKQLANNINLLKNSTLDTIYPSYCLICKNYNVDKRFSLICHNCLNNIEVIKKPYCGLCSFPYDPDIENYESEYFICGSCKSDKIYYDKVAVAAKYHDNMRLLIHEFKFKKMTKLATMISNLLIQKYIDDKRFGEEDLIVPVPLHHTKTRERGYNQSVLLAYKISEATNIPTLLGGVKRVKKTEPLFDKTKKERVQILKNAFKVVDNDILYNRKILLIDDIYTTGSTINELSKTLKAAGASEINVLIAAKAV